MRNQTTVPPSLLMESHGLAPNVRSTSFGSIKVWSKLYQAGSYFVDLNLGPDDQDLRLRGEILTQDDQHGVPLLRFAHRDDMARKPDLTPVGAAVTEPPLCARPAKAPVREGRNKTLW